MVESTFVLGQMSDAGQAGDRVNIGSVVRHVRSRRGHFCS